MLPTSGTLYTFDVAAALAAVGAPLVEAAPAPEAPPAPAFAPGTILLVDNELDTVEDIGSTDEDEIDAILCALNGPDGLRYSIDVAR